LLIAGASALAAPWLQDGLPFLAALGPVGYGPAGCSAMAMVRKRSACGQVVAKAGRTRDAVSMTRAPSLSRRKVANSAVAGAWVEE
jgi:hypothetical protein